MPEFKMAGKKKKKSAEKDGRETPSDGPMCHIASQLIPSAIFAAVPRTPLLLSQNWSKRTPSPLAKAIGEVGNIGRVIVGNIDVSNRPPQSLPEDLDKSGSINETNDILIASDEDSEEESKVVESYSEGDPGYETVKMNRDRFDKTTKFYRMQKDGVLNREESDQGAGTQVREDAEEGESAGEEGETSGQQGVAFYHVLDHEKNQVVEPPYSRVDKRRKNTPSPDKDEEDGGSDYMLSDDLTDVTSNEEGSSPSAKKSLDFTGHGRRKSGKGSRRGDSKRRRRKESGRDSADDAHGEVEDVPDGSKQFHRSRTSSRTRRTSETIEELSGEGSGGSHKEGSSEAPPAVAPYQEGTHHAAEGPKENQRRLSKSRLSPFEGRSKNDVDLAETIGASGRQSSDTKPTRDRDRMREYSPHNKASVLDDTQQDALREFERLTIEHLSTNAGLSDDDGSSYLFPTVPRSTDEFHERTRFEQEQFNESFFEEDFEPLRDEVGMAKRTYPSREGRVHASKETAANLEAGAPGEEYISAHPQEFPRSRPISGETSNSRSQQRDASQYLEQQKRLEELTLQQQEVYRQQVEQQESQRHQQQELIRQQWQLQEQLKSLERMQTDWQQVAADQAGRRSPREGDMRLQKELVQQQQEMLRRQQEQQKEYQQQQEQLLKQQDRLYTEIKHLEQHQQELQSHVTILSPHESLSAIRQTEQDIVSLLQEQREQQSRYEKLYREQQQKVHEQAGKFTEEKKLLAQQQKGLKKKIREQEERSRGLEKELEKLSHKQLAVKQKRSASMESIASQPREGQNSDRRHSRLERRVDGSTDTAGKPLHAQTRSLRDVTHEKMRGVRSDSRSGKSTVVLPRRRSEEDVYELAKPRIELLESEKSALMELNASLQEENGTLKHLAVSLQKGSGSSSVVLQHQVKDLHLETKVLRDAVHRLNVELSRYQAKYRPVSSEEVEGLALSPGEENAPWLVNSKYLSPLFMAYDDRLREKDDIVTAYDEELNAFKARVMEVVKENHQLHMSVNKVKPDALRPDEWQQLQEQAKLVVDENALLMEQQEVQENKAKEQQRVHGQEVSKLSKRITRLESEKRRLDTECEDLRRNHSNLIRKYEALVLEDERKIPLQDHMTMMDECRRILEDVKLKANTRAEENDSQLEAIQKEKNSLAAKVADANAINAQMKRELEAYNKAQRKSERKVLFFQHKLEHVQDRELAAQDTLSEVLKVAEKTAAERDNFVHFAKSQKKEQKLAASQIRQGNESIRGLQKKLEENKNKASEKVAVATGRLKEKEKEINKMRETHESEVNSLRALVRDKQRQLEVILGENRHVDKELELVWRTATADNKRMKSAARDKGAMFDSDSDPNGHVSSEEEGRR